MAPIPFVCRAAAVDVKMVSAMPLDAVSATKDMFNCRFIAVHLYAILLVAPMHVAPHPTSVNAMRAMPRSMAVSETANPTARRLATTASVAAREFALALRGMRP